MTNGDRAHVSTVGAFVIAILHPDDFWRWVWFVTAIVLAVFKEILDHREGRHQKNEPPK